MTDPASWPSCPSAMTLRGGGPTAHAGTPELGQRPVDQRVVGRKPDRGLEVSTSGLEAAEPRPAHRQSARRLKEQRPPARQRARHPTNVATRLQSLAEPGQVVIGPATRAAIGDRGLVEAVGLVGRRGKSRPVDAYVLRSIT
jgi:hypothetical protein